METERLVIRKQIGDHIYRLTVILDNNKNYKIISMHACPKVPIPRKLIELMDQRFQNLKELGNKLRSIESKLTKGRHNG